MYIGEIVLPGALMGRLSGLKEGDAMTADVSDDRAEAGDEDTGVVVAMEVVVDGDEEVDDEDAEETVAKRPPAAAADDEEEETVAGSPP